MELKMCEKGHFYDPTVDSSCPQCRQEQMNGANVGKTEGFEGLDSGNYETTGAVFNNGFGPTEPGDNMNFSGVIGPTEEFLSDENTMPINIVNKTSGKGGAFTPVVGWLVCIDGPAKGTDYRIRGGYINYIGRSENMDICVRGDNSISREKHALIAYDSKSKTFFVGPSEGKNLIYLNDGLVMNSQVIKQNDRLTIGTTVLMFIPLCGKEFDWNE